MTDMFSVIASTEDESSRASGMSRAEISSVSRVTHKFAKFVSSSPAEAEERIDFLKQDILNTVVAACGEHGISEREDIQAVLTKAMDSLRAASKTEEETEEEQEELDDEYEARLEREASTKVAEVPTGDTYHQETVDLPTSTADGSTTGLGGGVPEMSTGQVPESGLDPIDVPSNKNRGEMQEIRPKDFEEKLVEFDPAHSPVHEQVDVDKPIGEEQVGERTDTFSTPEGQASAVTSAASHTSRWRVEAE